MLMLNCNDFVWTNIPLPLHTKRMYYMWYITIKMYKNLFYFEHSDMLSAPTATLTAGSWRETTWGLQPIHRTAENIDRQINYSYCKTDWTIMFIIFNAEWADCTYTEKWTGAADRVRVHLTHGLVVEQGHPEETHTHTHTHTKAHGVALQAVFTGLHRFLDLLDTFTHSGTAEFNLSGNPDP